MVIWNRFTTYTAGSSAAFIFVFSFVVLSSPGCGSIELQSRWVDTEIIIDGVNDEWNDHADFLEDPGVVVSVRNDSEYLYLCLMTSNRKVQRQIMMLGLVVWFDGANDKSKDFGVRFPLGVMETDDSQTGPGPGRAGGPGRGDAEELFDEFFDKRIATQTAFDLIGPAGMGLRRVEFGELEQIEIKVGRSRGTLVYEGKVPLRRSGDDYYAIGTAPGELIGIGLDSPEMDRQTKINVMGGRRPPGGGMGGGTVGGMRGGTSRPRPDVEMPEAFEVWASVRLAAVN